MSRIAVFGDSIAWGSYDPEFGGWVQRMWFDAARRPGSTRLSDQMNYSSVFNLSIGGEVVEGVLDRFDVEAPVRTPDVIVIAIGINDAAHEGSPATPIGVFTDRYERLVSKASALVPEVVLVTPTNVDESRNEHDWRNDDIERFVAVIKAIGKEAGLRTVDVFGALTPVDLAPDGIHPGSDGHRRLYELVTPVVFEAADAIEAPQLS